VQRTAATNPEGFLWSTDHSFIRSFAFLRHAAGYYPAGAPPKSNQQAQIDMIEEVLSWAGVTAATKVRRSSSSSSTLALVRLAFKR
jgi:hypothetical protein